MTSATPVKRSAWALPVLAVLAAAACAVVAWEWMHGQAISLVSALTAAMLLAMLVLWPFLFGARVVHGHMEHARRCVECHALRWPGEEALGFCLRCGSTRRPVPVGY